MRSMLQLKVASTMVAVALVASTLTLLGLTRPAASIAMNRAVKLFDAIPQHELDKCQADRTGWAYVNAQGFHAYAFDRARNAPDNPDAPTLTALMSLRMGLGEREPLAIRTSDPSTVGLVFDTDRPQGCPTLFLVWPETENTRQGFVEQGALWLFVIGLIALFAGWRTTVRPLFDSVRALNASSRTVGREDFASASGSVDASLEKVATTLDDAHRRVLSEREHLLAHQQALENHLADIAHDLKTPIAALQLRLDELCHAADPEALRGALQDVAYLGLLTENLGAAGKLRLEGWTPERVPTDLGRLVTRVAERVAALGARRGIEVVHTVPDDPVVVSTAAVFAEQILGNLVHNAVVHNPSGGHAAVLLERVDAGFRIQVIDDGPGVSEGDLGRMRARGVQLGGSVSGEGAGLGLAIAIGLAEKLGWTLHFEKAQPNGLLAEIRGPLPPGSP